MSHGIPRTGGPKPVSEQARKKELRKIEEYKVLVKQVNEDVRSGNLSQDVLGKTSKLLQLNPEYYTIWNHRRLILRHVFAVALRGDGLIEPSDNNARYAQQIEDLISDDLNFLLPLLRQYPKCYWIWNYRSWLLNEATRLLSASASRRLWTQELALDGKMLSLDSRNFHGWGYRRAIVRVLENGQLEPEEKPETMTEAEFKYTTKMIESNLSNFSAWHHRSKLIPRLLNERQADEEARVKMLEAELEMIQRGLYTDPNDQSLWFYYQNLLCTFDPVYSSRSMAPSMSNEQRLGYVTKEIGNLLEMLDGAEDCKWIYQFLLHLCALFKGLAGEWPAQRKEMPKWLEELHKLDSLRAGRWIDMRRNLNL